MGCQLKASRKGLETVRTLRGLLDRFHTKTPYGALIELARLNREKEQLRHEIQRWEKRSEQIKTRLGEIEEAEKRLREFAAHDDLHLPWLEAQGKPLPLRASSRVTVLKY